MATTARRRRRRTLSLTSNSANVSSLVRPSSYPPLSSSSSTSTFQGDSKRYKNKAKKGNKEEELLFEFDLESEGAAADSSSLDDSLKTFASSSGFFTDIGGSEATSSSTSPEELLLLSPLKCSSPSERRLREWVAAGMQAEKEEEDGGSTPRNSISEERSILCDVSNSTPIRSSSSPRVRSPGKENNSVGSGGSDVEVEELRQILTASRLNQGSNLTRSKLDSLLSNLEGDREYPTIAVEHYGGPEPEDEGEQKKKTERGDVNLLSVPPPRRRRVPTRASSPADFSAALGLNKENSGAKVVKPSGEKEGDSETRRPFLRGHRRSCSTPELTESELNFLCSRSPSLQARRTEQEGSGGGRRRHATTDSGSPKEVEARTQRRAVARNPMLRSSSLKTGKSPQKGKKLVCFADVLGLSLVDVNQYREDLLPRVPKSAYRDLQDVDLPSDLDSNSNSSCASSTQQSAFNRIVGFPQLAFSASTEDRPPAPEEEDKTASAKLIPAFSHPGSFPNFFDLLNSKKVCLESAHANGARCSVSGTVRVRNLGFAKRVTVLYTTTEWMQRAEAEAEYMDGSCDGFSDRFSFSLALPSALAAGQRLQFCLRYEVNGEEFWDNNEGSNYSFQCVVTANGESRVGLPIVLPSVSRASVSGAAGPCYSPSNLSLDPWHRYQS